MVFDRYPVTPPAEGTYATNALRNNAKGTDLDKEALERFKIREICEGWGSYRDAAEWQNYRSMFFDDAYIATSWKQGNIDEFIKASKDGFAEGSTFMYIMHRICGSSVEVNPELTRAVCKMKITITCRFTFDGVEMDNESDCRFFFLLEKRQGRWGVCFYTLLFDKDKFIPVNPAKSFHIPEEEVDKFPSGYRYLAWAEVKFGHPPKLNLNSHGSERDILYSKCKDWLEGKAVKPDLTGPDLPNWKP
ncbi:hypothetical protein AbraIFM66951_011873 [Aspergillus brasiliensis]|uniref:SnoaL-like domain-containing protein n=1 Tax=Aspergillus brasiliensis TaxID=319629 RepID=A0A9W5YN73_9EURO|nr:hypothetical protein AbraCBS73388_004329 [Aspergillus brasiliensis]GKZ48118.1 hypothetical protein AbraIFM66951_011873 [Aspergillus brasiliensis]